MSAEEILTAEKAVEDRRRSRTKGFSKMKERDQNWRRLSNGVVMLWGEQEHFALVIPERHVPGQAKAVPKQVITFNTEDFRKGLRWA